MSSHTRDDEESGGGQPDRNSAPGSNSTPNRPPSGRTTGGLPFTFEDANQSFATPPMPPNEPPPSRGDVRPDSPQNPGNAVEGDILRPIPLEGVVSLVQRTEEDPPPNWYRTISKAIMAVILLPIFMTFGLVSLMLAIILAVLGFPALSHLFNPVLWMTAIFEFMEVFVLSRLQRSSQHTVYRGLVRDTDDRVFAFYLHGAPRSGLLVDGHRVRLFGKWRVNSRGGTAERGTLFVSQGEDLTTGSTIVTGRNGWRPVFFVLLAILLAIIASGLGYAP